MLTPDYLLHISEGAEDIAEQLHQDVLKRIIERITIRLNRGEDYLLTAADKWQLEMLQEAGYLREDIMKDIARRMKLERAEIRSAFEEAGVRNMAWDNAIYKAAGIDTVDITRSPYFVRLMQRGYEKTMNTWQNYTGTFADAAQQTFIRECDRAYNLATSGVTSYSQAYREAIERIAEDGVYVYYKDENGNVRHRDTIETATLRCVRTGIGQTCGDITKARMDEVGWDIVLVSAHLGARYGDGGENPSNHFWWQGKFYSRSGTDKRFPHFETATGYGTGEGLCGWNCRHSYGPGDGEFNPYEQYDSEENKRVYDIVQRQRALERGIRKQKRETMTLREARDNCTDEGQKAALDEKYQKSASKLAEQNKNYNDYCEENDLKRRADRVAIAKWDRAEAAKARGAGNSYNPELYRKTKNDKPFADLPERMTKKHVREVAKELDIPLKNITIVIDKDVEKLKASFPYSGRADKETVGRIDFFPKAFVSKEELARTLYHEQLHVRQMEEYGVKYVDENRAAFETITSFKELEFVARLKKEGKL